MFGLRNTATNPFRYAFEPLPVRQFALTKTFHPAPCTLHPTPYTLHPTPYTLHPTPYTLHPTPYTLNPQPSTLNPKPVGAVGDGV